MSGDTKVVTDSLSTFLNEGFAFIFVEHIFIEIRSSENTILILFNGKIQLSHDYLVFGVLVMKKIILRYIFVRTKNPSFILLQHLIWPRDICI